MRCFQIHRCSAVVIQRAFPPRDAHTPLVAWLQSGKTPLRMRCDQVVSIQDGEIQKFLRDLHANCVLPHVLWSCPAIAIAIKTGYRIATTIFQFRSQNIRRHIRKFSQFYLLSCGAKRNISIFPTERSRNDRRFFASLRMTSADGL